MQKTNSIYVKTQNVRYTSLRNKNIMIYICGLHVKFGTRQGIWIFKDQILLHSLSLSDLYLHIQIMSNFSAQNCVN